MSFFGNVAKAAKKVGSGVAKTASSTAKKAAKTATSTAKHVEKGAVSAANKAAHGVASAANKVAHQAASTAHHVEKGVIHTAKHVAHEVDHGYQSAIHGKAMLAVSNFEKKASHSINSAVNSGIKLAGNAGQELSRGVGQVIAAGITFGRDLEEIAEIYMEKGMDEINRLQKQTSFAVQLIRKMQFGSNVSKFGHEVVSPLFKHQISSSEAGRRLNSILAMDVRQEGLQRGLGSCIAVGVEADAGFIVGVGGAVGIVIDLKSGEVKGYGSVAGAIGAIEKVSGGLEIAWAPSNIDQFDGPSVGIALGGAYYVGLTIGVSTPLSTFADPLGKWQLDSITVGIPIGIGVEGELCIEDTWCFG